MTKPRTFFQHLKQFPEAAREGYVCPDFEPEAPEPTTALAGTREKLDVMARRLDLGQELCVPGDLGPGDFHDDGSSPPPVEQPSAYLDKFRKSKPAT